MHKPIRDASQFLLVVLFALPLTGIAYMAIAQPEHDDSVAQSPSTSVLSEMERNELFAKQLSGVKLSGHFSISGEKETELSTEEYELQGVMHVKGEFWLFQARIRYGDHDVTLPLTLPVRWAGDTPVICVDKMGFPGLGTYSARVMIYADHYAGFWTGGDHQGHLFGIVKKSRKSDIEDR